MTHIAQIDAFAHKLGAFARIFPRASADGLADAFVSAHLRQVQLNLSALGMPTIPDTEELAGMDLAGIRKSFDSRKLALWGVSATYNTAHPDSRVRARNTAKAAEFIATMSTLAPVAATLCTGSRNAENMWGRHPETNSESAWSDFRASLDVLLEAADRSGVLLAVEPEPANVVADAASAERLIRELGSDADRIGFILDPANLVTDARKDRHTAILIDAFTRLGDRTICVHAKDTVPWQQTLEGRGVVNYDLILDLHAALPTEVPLIIQDASEVEVIAIRDQLINAHLALATA